MFREMRRKNQKLPMEDCAALLDAGTSGVLALHGDDGYPYAVPLSYVYDGSKLYFHCGKTGHKLDAVKRNPRASFCVVGQDQVVSEEYTTYFRSVILFGTVRILEEAEEKRAAIEKLARRYAPGDSGVNRQREIGREWAALCMLEMSIDHMTGKEAAELARARAKKESVRPCGQPAAQEKT